MGVAASQTIALFRFPGQESAENARRLAQTIIAAGYRVQVFGFWPDDFSATDRDRFILEADLGSAHRLSAWAFRAKHGFEVENLRLSAHTFATEPLGAELILAESVLHQRLRGFADRVIEALAQIRPSHVFVPHGAEILSRLINAVAARKRYPLLFWESGFLPKHLYVDHRAPHFFRGLCSADTLDVSATAASLGSDLKRQWLSRGLSKYEQSGADDEKLAQWLSKGTDKVLFIPAQVPTDANVVTGLNHHASLADLYRDMLANVPAGWRAVFKPHPKADVDWSSLATDSSRIFVGDVSILSAMSASDAVLTHSSNAGLEALLLGKPVLTTGSPIYCRDDLARQISVGTDLKHALDDAQPAPSHAVERLLGHLAQTVLLADGDTESLVRKLNAASPVLGDYLSYYPARLRETVEAAIALDSKLRLNAPLERAYKDFGPQHAERLAQAITPDTLAQRPFGGPIMGEQWQLPLIGHNGSAERRTCFAHLENRPSPDLMLAELIRDVSHPVFSVRLSPEGASADVQSFTVEDLARLIQPTGVAFEIVSWPDGDYATVYLAKAAPSSLTPTTVWFPPEAFRSGMTAQTISTGDALSLATKHAHYGPYAALPAGHWLATRVVANSAKRNLLSHWRALMAARTMRLQILEHCEGAAPRIVHQTNWLRPKGTFEARKDCKYELRAFMPKAKTRLDGPRFYGFTLVASEDVSLTRLTSAP